MPKCLYVTLEGTLWLPWQTYCTHAPYRYVTLQVTVKNWCILRLHVAPSSLCTFLPSFPLPLPSHLSFLPSFLPACLPPVLHSHLPQSLPLSLLPSPYLSVPPSNQYSHPFHSFLLTITHTLSTPSSPPSLIPFPLLPPHHYSHPFYSFLLTITHTPLRLTVTCYGRQMLKYPISVALNQTNKGTSYHVLTHTHTFIHLILLTDLMVWSNTPSSKLSIFYWIMSYIH